MGEMSLADRVALVIDALDGEISRSGGDTYVGGNSYENGGGRWETRLGMGLTRLDAGGYTVFESDDLDDVDTGGAVTIEPNETKTVVEAEAVSNRGVIVMAVGANDEADCEYAMYLDNKRVVGGRTNSPLGILNDPFSFVSELNGYVYANERVEYRVTNNGAGEVEIAGRLHVRQ